MQSCSLVYKVSALALDGGTAQLGGCSGSGTLRPPAENPYILDRAFLLVPDAWTSGLG